MLAKIWYIFSFLCYARKLTMIGQIAIARADATTFICDREKLGAGVLSQISQWEEPSNRFKTEDTWVGLDICPQ